MRAGCAHPRARAAITIASPRTWPSLVLSLGATIIGIVASFVGMWCANRNNNEANFGMVRRRPRRAHARAPRRARTLCSPPPRCPRSNTLVLEYRVQY